MLNDKISLTPQDILDKEFKIDARGYRPQEVDKFLDTVINDYNEFITEIKNLKKELAFANDENNKLKNELRRIKANIEAAEASSGNTSVSNVDLLRRLSQLEKVVFGNPLYRKRTDRSQKDRANGRRGAVGTGEHPKRVQVSSHVSV